jgi:predicted Zn-dependent protease with MMP-like domain
MAISMALVIAAGQPPDYKVPVVLVFVALCALLFAWFGFDAARSLRRIKNREQEQEHEQPLAFDSEELDWEKLASTANEVIEKTIGQLPPELKKEAEEIGWSWFKWSADAGADNLLGHFWGPSRNQSAYGGVAIILYLGNLSAYCAEHGLDFEDEVRTTYLHELGHYLGFNESDLEERGLQ